MKLAAILAALAIAGCVDAPQDMVDAATLPDAEAVAVEPFEAEGTLWLPPSTGEEREETLVPFPVDAAGSAVLAHLVLGSTYGPLDLPPFLTDVLVELRAPDGTILAEGSLNMDTTELHLEVEKTGGTGEHTLALLSYGGSDENANGDRVDWSITVTPPEDGPAS